MRNILHHIAVLLQLLALAPVNTLAALGVTSNDCCAPQQPVSAAASNGDHCCVDEARLQEHDSDGRATPGQCSHPPSAQDQSDNAHNCTCCLVGTIACPVFLPPPSLLLACVDSHYSPHPLSTFSPAIDHPPCLL
ncbi:MAG: hypothetical protein IT211_00345 [Armatimonadetes bacterium]|nr:hypothetical protein [Armatimonadota bacterium]